MGMIRHHMIVVTGWDDEVFPCIYEKAVKLLGHLVTPVIDSGVNSTKTFFIAPDGSKEGWEISDSGDNGRGKLIKYIKAFDTADGSNYVKYAEIFYGDELANECKVLNHN